MLEIADDAVRERIELLDSNDRALSRANPFAVLRDTDELVTADQIAMQSDAGRGGVFLCPKCNGLMRHCTNSRGTPFFAHASAKGSCQPGFDTPSHLCIKRGLRSIGFDCEHTDAATGFRFDAYHSDTDTAVEVVSSGVDRYLQKISRMGLAGRTCLWIADSGSRSLGSRDGSERICLESLRSSGTVVVCGLFKPKACRLFSAMPANSLFAFYLGLVWRFAGYDRWQLLGSEHFLSKAATADDGMKCLMVKMHAANAVVVVQNRRSGKDRKTWFDRTFRYRGVFTTSWTGDRDYIVDLVAGLVRDVEACRKLVVRQSGIARATPAAPAHASVADVIERINSRHSVGIEEAKQLRQIAEQSRVTQRLESVRIKNPLSMPIVVTQAEVAAGGTCRGITSSRWGRNGVVAAAPARLAEANRRFAEASGTSLSVSPCRPGFDHKFVTRRFGDVLYDVCEACGVSRRLPGRIKSRRV